ncbi:MAG: carbohydrate binding domain-containing protein, partial [Phycisphaerae bacterium]
MMMQCDRYNAMPFARHSDVINADQRRAREEAQTTFVAAQHQKIMMRSIARPRFLTARRNTTRRGSTYAIVLMASLIVVSIGLSSLASVRIQARIAEAGKDSDAAKRMALAGLEYGLLYLNQDTSWRAKLADAGWSGKVSLGDGKFTMTASDPVDANLLDAANDPVVIRSVGEVGKNRHLLEARFDMAPLTAAIKAAVFSAGSIAIVNSTLTADADAHAVGNISAFSSVINADVTAQGSISGSTYNGTQQPTTSAALVAPSNATALAYYLSNGTAISYNSLPYREPNQVTNSTIDEGIDGWTAVGTTVLSHSTSDVHSGAGALAVTGRSNQSDGAQHTFTPQVVSNENYRVSAWVKTVSDQNFKFELTLRFSGGSTLKVTTPNTRVRVADSWTYVEHTTPLSYNQASVGALTSIDMLLRTQDTGETGAYIVDEIAFRHVCGVCTTKYISGELLSPGVNTLSGGTNAQGIYVIDCANQNLIVENSRINGTLVLRNPGAGSQLRGAMNMEAAVPGYPTLMVEGFLNVNTTTAPLTEALAGRNLNPSSAEYPRDGGTSDSDTTDAYPSHFQGIVFSTGGFSFGREAAVTGTVIANHSINFNQVDFSVTHDSKIAANPPPGFTDLPY